MDYSDKMIIANINEFEKSVLEQVYALGCVHINLPAQKEEVTEGGEQERQNHRGNHMRAHTHSDA